MSPSAPSMPSARVVHVDTRGAIILQEESPETRDSRGIYLPNYIELVSHIAVDVGGSLIKVVYFTRYPGNSSDSSNGGSSANTPPSPLSLPRAASERKEGALTPFVLDPQSNGSSHFEYPFLDDKLLLPTVGSRSSPNHSIERFPGGSLNFERFETDDIDECIEFLRALIERSANMNMVSVEEMRQSVTISATGGGAHKFYDLFQDALGVEVSREDEMECLIEGLKFITQIPDEVYYFSDALVAQVTERGSLRRMSSSDIRGHGRTASLERPSPNPPQYAVTFESNPWPQLPCLLVNIGSGVSIVKVDKDGQFERVSGTSLGGGTLWGLLSLLTPANDFDEMLALSEKGDNAAVDMLVGDIYGQSYNRIGLKSNVIASSFGKVFKKGREKVAFKPEDISRSLLYAVSNNIGQIAYMNAEKYDLDRIYFGGYFIRGHAATIATLSYAIRFWSKGTKRALFLRHEGFLGALGAWIKSIDTQEHKSQK